MSDDVLYTDGEVTIYRDEAARSDDPFWRAVAAADPLPSVPLRDVPASRNTEVRQDDLQRVRLARAQAALVGIYRVEYQAIRKYELRGGGGRLLREKMSQEEVSYVHHDAR